MDAFSRAAIEAWSIFKNDCPFADWAAFINGWNAALAHRDVQAKAVNQQMLDALNLYAEGEK